MPKARKQKERGSVRKAEPARFKFKLGGRKNSTSALALSTDELLKKYDAPSMKKDRNKIAQVLNMRGVYIGTSVEEELETSNED